MILATADDNIPTQMDYWSDGVWLFQCSYVPNLDRDNLTLLQTGKRRWFINILWKSNVIPLKWIGLHQKAGIFKLHSWGRIPSGLTMHLSTQTPTLLFIRYICQEVDHFQHRCESKFVCQAMLPPSLVFLMRR